MGRTPLAVLAAAALGLAVARGWAQESPQPARAETPKAESKSPEADRRQPVDQRCTPGAALRVQLLITRLQGEKKQASLPYTFVVSARPSSTCPASRVRMRMGVDTPVPTFVADEKGTPTPVRSVQYKTVGTNIDCMADDLGDGRYKLFLTVENSSALPGDKSAGGDLGGYPLFRKFEISLDPILRDGQKAETVASTDPVTGEVVRIDVSLNVVK
jgi:hypothetical protein